MVCGWFADGLGLRRWTVFGVAKMDFMCELLCVLPVVYVFAPLFGSSGTIPTFQASFCRRTSSWHTFPARWGSARELHSYSMRFSNEKCEGTANRFILQSTHAMRPLAARVLTPPLSLYTGGGEFNAESSSPTTEHFVRTIAVTTAQTTTASILVIANAAPTMPIVILVG